MRLLIILFVLLTLKTYSVELIKVSDYSFDAPESPEDILLGAMSITVTDFGTTIISDYKAYNLKVYRAGKLIQQYGSKGTGPGEFCFPDKVVSSGNKLVVYDYKSRRIILLKLTASGTIDEKVYDPSFNFCADFDVDRKGNILLGGVYYNKSGKTYLFKDLSSEAIMVKRRNAFGNLAENNPTGATIVMAKWDNFSYIARRDNLSTLVQYNSSSDKLKKLFKSSRYYAPIYPNKKLETNRAQKALKGWPDKTRNQILYNAKRGRCMVNTLAADKYHLYITCFRYPLETEKTKRLPLIVYKHSGELVGEFLLPEHDIDSSQITALNKKTNEIHIFTITEKDDNTEIKCTIMKLK